MKMSVRRWLGASTLALFASFAVAGCSGDQDAEDGIEASDNQAADNANGNAVASEDNGGGEKPAGDESNAAPSNAAGADTAAEAGAAGGNSTENDLQEIITEMNGQQGGDKEAAAGAEGAAPLAGEAPAAAPAPAVASAPAAAAAPAPAAAPAAGGNSATADAKSAALPFQPGGTPAAAGLPELGSKMSYFVEKGDTLAKISQKIYGAPSHWQEMATLSGLSNPSRIFPGDLVYYTLDETAVTFAKAYDSVQRSEEQVKPGDTLATISQRLYGSTESWRTLWRHNDKIENPDVVQPGSTVFYVAKGALQAAIDHVKSGSTTNLATLKAKDSTTTNSPAISAKSLSMSHHKKHHRAHALDASVNLTLSQTNVNVSVNAINAING
jgi:nucleoid-associated protein YgaU